MVKKEVLLSKIFLFVISIILSAGFVFGAVITQCGTEINQPGTYILESDLNGCTGSHAIAIRANGVILDCQNQRISGNAYYGITIQKPNNVEVNNIEVKNCRIEYFDFGINLHSTTDSIISSNTIKYNKQGGIDLHSSDSNIISSNTIDNTYGDAWNGIILTSSSDYNTISSNNVIGHVYNGISLSYSSNNEISGNTGTNNDVGIKLDSSTNNYGCSNNVISISSDCVGCTSGGNHVNVWQDLMGTVYCCGVIFTQSGTYNLDADMDCSGNAIIIRADDFTLDCQNHKITGDGTGVGIRVNNADNVNVKRCKVENFQYGIYLSLSFESIISSNTLNNNKYGEIYLTSSNNNDISSNIINNNQYGKGIYLTSSNNNDISSNTVDNNYYEGIVIASSSYNTISSNTINNNGYDGILIYSGSSNNLFSNTGNGNGHAAINKYGINLYSGSSMNYGCGNIVTGDSGNCDHCTDYGNHVNEWRNAAGTEFCCQSEADPCGTSYDPCCDGLYCSTENPTTGEDIGEENYHCCDEGYWWDPNGGDFGTGGCEQAATCSYPFVPSPFNPNSLAALPLPYEQACCSFESIYAWQNIETY